MGDRRCRRLSFADKVYLLCKKIPKGRISTYKLVAEKLNIKAYRAVGNALNKNKNKSVPCHRVVKSNGFVGGFA
ncbi:MGMT family protein, partial [Candidatus Woesearchaeota archaeon]|nr:MGMT family protein [Candidatus Woesearchaeota archaeon]